MTRRPRQEPTIAELFRDGRAIDRAVKRAVREALAADAKPARKQRPAASSSKRRTTSPRRPNRS